MLEVAVVSERTEDMDCDGHFHFMFRRLGRMESLNPSKLDRSEKDEVSSVLWFEFQKRWGQGAIDMMTEHGLIFPNELMKEIEENLAEEDSEY